MPTNPKTIVELKKVFNFYKIIETENSTIDGILIELNPELRSNRKKTIDDLQFLYRSSQLYSKTEIIEVLECATRLPGNGYDNNLLLLVTQNTLDVAKFFNDVLSKADPALQQEITKHLARLKERHSSLVIGEDYLKREVKSANNILLSYIK